MMLQCYFALTCLSIWACIQLVFMGFGYIVEAVTLFYDAMPEDYDDYDDFVAKTKANYRQLAINCWLAALMYALMILYGLWGYRQQKKKLIEEARRLEDDDLFCNPKISKKLPKAPPIPKKERKKKEKPKEKVLILDEYGDK